MVGQPVLVFENCMEFFEVMLNGMFKSETTSSQIRKIVCQRVLVLLLEGVNHFHFSISKKKKKKKKNCQKLEKSSNF